MLPLMSAHSTIWLALVVGLAVAAVAVTPGGRAAIRRPARARPPSRSGCASSAARRSARCFRNANRATLRRRASGLAVVRGAARGGRRLAIGLRRIPVRADGRDPARARLGLLAGGELRARLRGAARDRVSPGIWRLVPRRWGSRTGARAVPGRPRLSGTDDGLLRGRSGEGADPRLRPLGSSGTVHAAGLRRAVGRPARARAAPSARSPPPRARARGGHRPRARSRHRRSRAAWSTRVPGA